MDGELFLRVRGRVLGPYDQEKLQGLVRRGQLSRMHELSADGVSWTRASNFPDLFISAPIVSPTAESESAPVQTLIVGDDKPQGQWHYSSAGVERGPVDFFNLQMLAGTGQLSATDMVWTQGMANWMPAAQIPGLLRTAAASSDEAAAGGSRTDKTAEMSALFRAAASSRSWALCIAIMLFVWTGVSAVGGVYVLGVGGRNTIILAVGLFNLVYALLYGFAGFLLLSYANQLKSLRFKPQTGMLTKALDALRAFWIYTSILIIVFSAFTLVAGIWFLAVFNEFR